MQLTFCHLEKEHALAIINWRYSSPYDYYNFDAATIQEDLHYLLDSKNNFWAILNLQGELEGYCSFGSDGQVPGGDYSTEALDLGMGIRPDLVGRGQGKQYAQAVVSYAVNQYRAQQLRVTIAEFNQRAQRVWEQLGFGQVEKFVKIGSEEEFVIMIRAFGTGSCVMEIRELRAFDREWSNSLLSKHFDSPRVVSRGRLHDASALPGLVAIAQGTPVGLLHYQVDGSECEIVALIVERPREGIGTALLNQVCGIARASGCSRLWLVTTNDNTVAQSFYRALGWRLVAVHRGAIVGSRLLKARDSSFWYWWCCDRERDRVRPGHRFRITRTLRKFQSP